MRYRWMPLLVLVLLATACAKPKLVVMVIESDDTAAMEGALRWRISPHEARAILWDPARLWNEITLSPADVAVLGFTAETGPWRVPFAYLAGDPPGRNGPRLDDLTMRRLLRFLNHTREHPDVIKADPEVRRRVLAAHTARALGTEILARDHARALFVHLDARAPDLPAYCADAARDLLMLTGKKGGGLVFIRDLRRQRLLIFTERPVTEPHQPTRSQVAALMKQMLEQ